MQKRGGSELDWMISLAIFLLYVAWFFVYVSPLTSRPEDEGPMLTRLNDKLKANTTWNIDEVPIFIWSNTSGTDEPAMADFPYEWNSTSFSFKRNNTFILDENKLLFIINISQGKNLAGIVHSSENYNAPTDSMTGLSATKDSASTSNMKVEFSSAIPSRIKYGNQYLIDDINLTIGTESLNVENHSATISSISKYKAKSQALNHTSYVFANSPKIYNLVRSLQDINLTLSSVILNMTSYHTGTVSGNLNLNNTCMSMRSQYIDFSSDISGASIILDKETNISICVQNSTTRLYIYFRHKNETRYDFITHDGNYNSTLKYISALSIKYGIRERKTGLSEKLLQQLNGTNYSSLKSAWHMKQEFSFSISNSSDSIMYNYEPKKASNENVFADESTGSLLDQYGNRQTIIMRVRTW
ncbi:hypothetical protein HYU11_04800 [Candidatus Woesearchaeota archaeon]|nr:hypothetical protein [Candidatus Woesearchaeota archaeon]